MGLALPDQDIDPVPGLKVFARKRILAGLREILTPVPSVVSPPCPPSGGDGYVNFRPIITPVFTHGESNTQRTVIGSIRMVPDFSNGESNSGRFLVGTIAIPSAHSITTP